MNGLASTVRTAALVAALADAAFADTEVFEGNLHQGSIQYINNGRYEYRLNPDGLGRQVWHGLNLGLDFLILADDFYVTELGIWDDNSDGLKSDHVLSIFDITTGVPTLLAATEINAGTGDLAYQYRYVPLDEPLYLPPGTEISLVVTYELDNWDSNGNSGTIYQNLEPRPTFNDGGGALIGIGRARAGWRGAGGRFGPDDFPTWLDTGPYNRYHAGSFRYVIPEPGALALLGAGLVILWRRRKASNARNAGPPGCRAAATSGSDPGAGQEA